MSRALCIGVPLSSCPCRRYQDGLAGYGNGAVARARAIIERDPFPVLPTLENRAPPRLMVEIPGNRVAKSLVEAVFGLETKFGHDTLGSDRIPSVVAWAVGDVTDET